MKQSELYLFEVLNNIDSLAPIKISLNGIVLYNDYDSCVPIGDSTMYGESSSWQEVIPKRLWQAKEYLITDVKIKIVQHHHSIIELRGYYEPHSTKEA